MNFIERLQNKPHYIRVQILWIAVILTMVVITLIWLSLLNFSLGGISENEQNDSREKQSFPSLFTTIKEDFSLLKKSLQAGVEGIMGGKEKESIEVEILKPLKLPE